MPDPDPARVLVYGAGGHAKVVADVARAAGLAVAAFLEDGDDRHGQPFAGAAIVSWSHFAAEPQRWAGLPVLPAIGDNAGRAAACDRVYALGFSLATAIHPSAVISPDADVGPGTVVMPRVVVNAAARVGGGVILNSGAVVEHDCTVGDFAHLSPNAALGGGCTVGPRAHLGLGAVALPRTTVGPDARVGAGAVVLADVPAGATVVGIPARPLPARTDTPPSPAPLARPLVSFVIPVFRNKGTVRTTYERIREVLASSLPDFDYQFVLVDDGSDDGSLDEILALRRDDPRVDVLSFARNFGQVPAIIAGLRAAAGDATVVMSADLQDPPALIVDMVRAWQEGNPVVVCYRTSREDSLAAALTSRVFYGLMHLSNARIPSGGFDYVLLGREPRQVIAALRDRNRFFQGDVLWPGFPAKFLPYTRQRRPVGRSQWTLGKKLKYFIDGLLNTSYLPIRFMSFLGVGVALLGLVYALVVVWIRLMNEQPYIGYAPIMIVMLVTSGLIMTMLGVIGEYLWRIYDETRARPLYVLKHQDITPRPDRPATGAPLAPGSAGERGRG